MEKRLIGLPPTLDPWNQRGATTYDDLKRLLMLELIYNYQTLLFVFPPHTAASFTDNFPALRIFRLWLMTLNKNSS